MPTTDINDRRARAARHIHLEERWKVRLHTDRSGAEADHARTAVRKLGHEAEALDHRLKSAGKQSFNNMGEG